MDTNPERFRAIAQNLLTLEVNTIVTRGITAPKMPLPEHALIEIVNTYRDFLNGVFARSPNQAKLARDVDRAFLTTTARVDSFAVFEEVRTFAQTLLSRQEELPVADRLTSKEAHLLSRIWDNADQMKGVFSRLPDKNLELRRDEGRRPTPLQLEPQEIVLIRKVWELGTDVILTQTVIQLDGDVVTRLREDLLLDGHAMENVLKVHDRAVGTSMGFWHGMVSVLGVFLRGVAELAFPPPRR